MGDMLQGMIVLAEITIEEFHGLGNDTY